MIDIKKLKKDIEGKIINSEKVVILPHNNVDFDAIGSSLGLSLIAKKLKKKSYIIVNDKPHLIDPGVKLIIDIEKDDYNIVNKDKYKCIFHPNDLYILTDVNKKHMISISDLINNEENVTIIDHHDSDDKTFNTQSTYIDTSYSSSSEIVTSLISNFKIKIPSNIANYLYAGIFLDTARLTKNCSADTMKAAAKLLESGANINSVNDLFREDFLSDRKVQNLISRVQMIDCRIALIIAGEDEEYRREEIAKAADYSLKYGADASFVVGKIEDNIISISGRSKEKINVGYIMSQLGGGGNNYSGATRFEDASLDEIYKKLIKVIRPSYYIKE